MEKIDDPSLGKIPDAKGGSENLQEILRTEVDKTPAQSAFQRWGDLGIIALAAGKVRQNGRQILLFRVVAVNSGKTKDRWGKDRNQDPKQPYGATPAAE